MIKEAKQIKMTFFLIQHTVFYKNFHPTTNYIIYIYYIYIYNYIDNIIML